MTELASLTSWSGAVLRSVFGSHDSSPVAGASRVTRWRPASSWSLSFSTSFVTLSPPADSLTRSPLTMTRTLDWSLVPTRAGWHSHNAGLQRPFPWSKRSPVPQSQFPLAFSSSCLLEINRLLKSVNELVGVLTLVVSRRCQADLTVSQGHAVGPFDGSS